MNPSSNRIAYNGIADKGDLQKMENRKNSSGRRKFHWRCPLAATLAAGVFGSIIAVGVWSRDVEKRPGATIKTCVLDASREKRRVDDKWRHKLSNEVLQEEDLAEAKRKLAELIKEKHRIEESFAKILEGCSRKE